MKTEIVTIPHLKQIIQKSSWGKKELADYHLDALLFCEYGCKYCSSNSGLHLKFKKHSIQTAVKKATATDFNPHDAGHIVIQYEELVQALNEELDGKSKRYGHGKTIVYSQLTDGFSPVLVQTGTARQVLEAWSRKRSSAFAC